MVNVMQKAPKLFDCFNRPDPEYEENSGEVIVEKTGYVEANILIENMIYAGQRLDLARSEMYDFAEDEEDDGYVDPTRSKSFDPAEASQLGMAATVRLAEQRKLFEKEKAAKEKATKEAAAAEAEIKPAEK